jgi:hypothetical protein
MRQTDLFYPLPWLMDNCEFPCLCIVSSGECLSEMAKLDAWVTSSFSVASLIL